ncbi:MAG: diguanylate cyclase domain-containing protein [Solirubrobacteraceae bacterium]
MSSDTVPDKRGAEQAFSCALTAVILARVRRVAGDDAVAQLLDRAASTHDAEYLEDLGNWVAYDEAIALLDAGETITFDPGFARHVGEDGMKVLGGSATASVLRSLGSPEEHLKRLNVSAKRYSSAAELDAIEVRPGYADIRAVAAAGFVRHRQHCQWTVGMLSLATSLFGLAPAKVEHISCQALGAPDCRYHLTWDPDGSGQDDSSQVAMLRLQLDSLSERMQGVFETTTDLISTGDLEETLHRIADRAAQQVRAPRHLLAVRPSPDAEIVFHQRGLDEDEAQTVARRIFENEDLPDNWCVATVRSRQREYGRLVAMYEEGAQFFPQERELLDLYARYAATALDSATALMDARLNRDEAQRRHEEARALLNLARLLASAGTSDDIAQRLADAIPNVIDCDRVAVSLWDDEAGELVRRAVNASSQETMSVERFRPEDIPRLAAWLKQPDPEPHFIDMNESPLKGPLGEVGAVASVAVPIATSQHFLGTLHVSVRERPERLAPSAELSDLLSGVAAHAVIALENGRLVDHITHQAHHDQLTGLANRLAFGERMSDAIGQDGPEPTPFALFYIDLDRFKPVNDEFGHEVGDSVLRAVAERLCSCAREGDTVARLGGDEFAVIVAGIDQVGALDIVAARFDRAFESPFIIDGQRLTVRASIGRAVWPIDAPDIEGLLREADATMYQVKRSRPGNDRAGSRASDRGSDQALARAAHA